MSSKIKHEDIARGEALYNEGRYAEALHIFYEVLAADPLNTHVLCQAGLACGAAGDVAQSAFYFEQALRVDPVDQGAFYGLMELLLNVGDLDLVQEAFIQYGVAVPESEEKGLLRDALFASGDGQSSAVHVAPPDQPEA